MVSILGIFCYFVVWTLCSLHWEFSVCRNWLCGLCGLCIGNFLFGFSVILLCGLCALYIGNFLFAGIGCVDYVVFVLEILCFGNFLLFCESGFCALCTGNFLFAEISCVDYVGSELRIFYLQKFLVWIM